MLFVAFAVSVSAYLEDRLRNPVYGEVRALEADHRKILQGVYILAWLFAFATASMVLVFFNSFLLGQIPQQLQGSDPVITLMSSHAIGAIFFLGGMAIIIIAPLMSRLGQIEEALNTKS
jgi:hypothetical protein